MKVLANGQLYAFSGSNRDLATLQAFAKDGYKSVTPEPNPLAAASARKSSGEPPSLVADEAGHDEILLTQQNFYDRLSSGRWLVAATAPWCGHCKALQPTLNELAKVTDAKFSTGSIDCDADGPLCRDLHVKSFPTLMVIDGNNVHFYGANERSVAALTNFANSGFQLADRIQLPGANRKNLLPRKGG